MTHKMNPGANRALTNHPKEVNDIVTAAHVSLSVHVSVRLATARNPANNTIYQAVERSVLGIGTEAIYETHRTL